MNARTIRTIAAAYTAKNNAGEGFAPVAGVDSVDDSVEALEADGWTVEASQSTSDDVAIVSRDGVVWAIGGDGRGNGAWAVDVSDA